MLVDDDLYYVANSRAGRANADAAASTTTSAATTTPRAPAILRLTLPRDR